MIAHEWKLRGSNQRRHPRKELHWTHHSMSAPLARRLHQIGDSTISQKLDAIERQWRPRAVAKESLAAFVIVRGDAHCAVDIEAVARCRKAPLLPIESAIARVVRRQRPREERACR